MRSSWRTNASSLARCLRASSRLAPLAQTRGVIAFGIYKSIGRVVSAPRRFPGAFLRLPQKPLGLHDRLLGLTLATTTKGLGVSAGDPHRLALIRLRLTQTFDLALGRSSVGRGRS
jgi:hypothetical protein